LNYSGFAVNGSFEKPLKPDEEACYLEKSAEGDSGARDLLIERNLRLVVHIVKKYAGNLSDSQDLISIGTIGLIKGISTFDSKKGARLATYAAKCIENEILMHLRHLKKESNMVSLNEPIGSDFEGNEITFMDIITVDEISVEDEIHTKNQVLILHEKMKKSLKNRERFILALRYGLYNGVVKTQREIGKALGISRSYVSRIEKKAIQKLKLEMEKDLRIEK
jgi:RNA polymerase sporulation-specific sigma factor